MQTFLGYTLSSERPPLHGKHYVSITQLCHEKTAFPSHFLNQLTQIYTLIVRNAG
jgi:hypothetical protein